MMKRAICSVVIMLVGAGIDASAQAPGDLTIMVAPGGAIQAVPVPEPMFEAAPLDVLTIEPFEVGEPVHGAPYSAEVVTEVVQELPDGNRIERRSTSRVARDSRGRVRRDQPLAAIGQFVPQQDIRVVTISDPVAGVHYSLDPVRKIAMRTRPMMARAPRPQTAPIFAAPAAETSPEVRTEPLGTREIEGIRVEGTRTTLTLAAGAIGNQRPIEVVSERWFSPELRVVVLSTRSDPRVGTTTYQLTNIERAEPAAELFQVPPEYRIQDFKPLPPPVIPEH